MSNETMSMETKQMEFACETGQTVLINHNIRLSVRPFRAKNGRQCLKLFIQLPKDMEVFQTKRSFEEMAALHEKPSKEADLLNMLKNVLKTPEGQEALALSEANPRPKITVKKKGYASKRQVQHEQG